MPTLTLHIPAGEANPAAVGKDVGPLGINIMEFCREFNALTQDRRGFVIPAVLTVNDDRSFTVRTKQPTTASLIRHVMGGGNGVITRDQLNRVARAKLPDLNTGDLAKAETIIAGTARSMGLTVRW
jgi:large subunit ribosomal protein L11